MQEMIKTIKGLYGCGWNQYEIANILGYSRGTIQSWMKQFNISRRSHSESLKMTLHKNPSLLDERKKQLRIASKNRDFNNLRTGKEISCEVCGRKKYVCGAFINKHKHHFCSRKCNGLWQRAPDGIRVKDSKYIRIKVNGKWMAEHHYVWLRDGEWGFIPEGFIVHHKNLNRLDNRIENLACIPEDVHSKMHFELYRNEKSMRGD